MATTLLQTKSSALLALLAVCLATVRGEYACVEYARSDLPEPCASMNPSSWAYIDLNSSNTLSAQIAYTWALQLGIQGFGVLSPQCLAWSELFFCQAPKWDDGRLPLLNCAVDAAGVPASPPTSVPICRDTCTQFLANCAASFARLGPGVEQLFGPAYCSAYSNDGVVVAGQRYPCWNASISEPVVSPNLTCPEYSQRTARGVCQPVCPSPEYSTEQVFDIGLMQQIVGWISLVSAGLLAAWFAARAPLRAYPSRLILYLLLSSVLISLGFVLATFVGGNVGDVWCGAHDTYSPTKLDEGGSRTINSDGVCVLQGWCLMLGTLTLSFFWAALAVNTARTINMNINFKAAVYSLWFEAALLAVCIGVPLALTVVAAAADQLVYEATDTFCFVSSANSNAWRIALWFVPVGLALLVGSAASVWCLVVLSHFKRSDVLTASVRLLVCMFFYMAAIAVFFASIIVNTSQLSNNAVEIFGYLVCIYGGIDEPVCRQRLYNRTALDAQYGLSSAATCLMAATGVILVAIFGTTARVLDTLPSSSTMGGNSSSSLSKMHTPASRSTSSPTAAGSPSSATIQV